MWRGLLRQWHVRGYRQDYSQPGLGLTGAQDRCVWLTPNIVFKIKWLSFKIAREAIPCSGIHRCFLASATFKAVVAAAGSLSYKDTGTLLTLVTPWENVSENKSSLESNYSSGIWTFNKSTFSSIKCLLSVSQQTSLFMGQISARKRWQKPFLKKVRQSCRPMMQRSQWLHLLHSFISLYC